MDDWFQMVSCRSKYWPSIINLAFAVPEKWTYTQKLSLMNLKIHAHIMWTRTHMGKCTLGYSISTPLLHKGVLKRDHFLEEIWYLHRFECRKGFIWAGSWQCNYRTCRGKILNDSYTMIVRYLRQSVSVIYISISRFCSNIILGIFNLTLSVP